MKTLPKIIGVFVLVLFATLASGSAMAQHHGHGYGHGYGYGGGVRFGISLGFPLYAPGYYPAPYYAYPAPVYSYPAPAYAYPAPAYTYPGAMMGSSSPPVYVEQSLARAAPAPSQAQGDWFYCPASRSYYPYVGECPAGWQRVPAQPPPR
jgi:hypothetical protein